MVRTRSVTHVALYDSAYIILFDDGSFSSHGLSKNLKRELNRNKSLEIEFISLGPDEQWFFRLYLYCTLFIYLLLLYDLD